MAATTQSPSSVRSAGNLIYDVVELILDRGVVIDVFARVSLVGIEIVTVDARVVVASVDTYLRFAEACGRLDLTGSAKPAGLPGLLGSIRERSAKGALEGGPSSSGRAVTEAFPDLRPTWHAKGAELLEEERDG